VSRVHVLLVTPEFPPQRGGIGTHCHEMASHWRGAAEVTVLAPAGDGRSRLGRLLRLRARVRRVLRERRVDVVYVAHWRASGVAVRLADPRGRRVTRWVQAVHGSEVLSPLRGRGLRNALLRRLFRWTTARADAFVALGVHQACLLERLGVDRRRVVVSPEGVDPARFQRVDGALLEQVRARHRLEGRRVLLTVGRLVERKGHDMVIRVLPAIRRAVPDAVYLIVGTGPRERDLRELAASMGVAGSVLFCGAVSERELAAYYHACDVFVMPSREVDGDVEGFGITFMEAAACARPCVGGRTGGVAEAVADGETGLLVDPHAAGEIAAAAVRLLTDPELARRMGAAGRRRVLAEFRYAQIAEHLLEAALR
jgi:phosphatidylinositol alpha-1,6-mannosyltransferase